MIPLCRPHLTEDDIEAVTQVLRSGHWAGGPMVRAFEAAFAEKMGGGLACASNSCASALQLALEVLPRKGEVIVPSFTFAASANACVKAGFDPVFIDVDPRTGNLDPSLLEACRTPRTVAVMPVHFAGLPCDLEPIVDFCRRCDLALVEDCAEAAGARYRGRVVGTFGTGCFSFFPTKNLSTGEGGMTLTQDAEADRRMRTLRGHGVVRSTEEGMDWRRDVAEPGYNFRLNDIQAALGLSQLARLEAMNAHRRALAERYRQALAGEAAIQLPEEPDGFHHVYQMFPIRVDPARVDRNRLVLSMRRAGVECSVHFDPPLHLTRAYRGVPCPAGMRHTEALSASIVTLPISAVLTPEEVDTVVSALRAGLSAAAVPA